MRRWAYSATLLALVTTLARAACGSPTPATSTASALQPRASGAVATPATPGPPQPAASPSPSPSASPSPTPRPSPSASAASVQCSFKPAYQSGSAALVKQVEDALLAAKLTTATVTISEYGETRGCTDNTGGFLVMERTFTVTQPVADLADRQALGLQLAQVLTVLDQFAKASQNRYFVTFTAAGQKLEVASTPTDWTKARGQGLTGAALLDALQRR